jgi:hypothetical protein
VALQIEAESGSDAIDFTIECIAESKGTDSFNGKLGDEIIHREASLSRGYQKGR